MENKNFTKEIKFGNHIQIKRGNGSPQGAKDSFKVGELGYDLTNNDLYIRAESDMVRIGSNIVDTATANSKDLITSHGVSVIKGQVDKDISSLQKELGDLKKTMVDLLLPVGTVITNASSTFDPNKIYQGTTWQRIKGRVIVGVDESDNDFKTSGKSGGHKQMQSHNHSGTVATNGNHTHSISIPQDGEHKHYDDVHVIASERFYDGFARGVEFTSRVIVGTESYDSGNNIDKGDHDHSLWNGTSPKTVEGGSHVHSLTIGSSGGGNSGNLQPYITKYVWERTT